MLLLVLACFKKLPSAECPEAASGDFTCAVPGYPDRPYDVKLPDGYAGQAVPVVLNLHGGGGNRRGQARTTCSENLDSGDCFHDLGRTQGFAVVYPDGTGLDGWKSNFRAWAAGGGEGEWRCTAVPTCERDIDDIAFFNALLDDLEARMAVDTQRVYVTGISNGGAMSHALACELSDRIAAIAPVGGAMQWTTSRTCTAADPVAVMHIHGTADPCWKFEGGAPDCLNGQPGLKHVSVERTLTDWAEILGADAPTAAPMKGTTTTVWTYPGGRADLLLLSVDGGGHTWPDGHQYLSEDRVGPAWRDWGDEVIWDFFEDKRL